MRLFYFFIYFFLFNILIIYFYIIIINICFVVFLVILRFSNRFTYWLPDTRTWEKFLSPKPFPLRRQKKNSLKGSKTSQIFFFRKMYERKINFLTRILTRFQKFKFKLWAFVAFLFLWKSSAISRWSTIKKLYLNCFQQNLYGVVGWIFTEGNEL